jgi:glycolate oxidase FAD binding subunit
VRGDSGKGRQYDDGSAAVIATTSVAARLEGVLGANRIGAGDEELREFAVDGVVPKAIVRPTSSAEVVEIVRFAASDGLSLVASGARSKLGMGMPPARFDIAVDMRTMQGIAHFDAGDLTLSVEAGMTLGALEKVLGEKHQFLPIAVPGYEASTIGGAVASGIDSTLRQQYGTARDFLIGAEFVEGKGTLCKSGGRVVKNVTGYDLHKLLVGSLGTLGIITRLNFRTFPLPRVFGGFISGFGEMQAALSFREALLAKGLPIANIEVLDPEAAKLVRAALGKTNSQIATLDSNGQWIVTLSYEGNEAVVQRITRELEALARDGKALSGGEMESRADAQLGGVLREAFDWLRRCAPAVALFRITLPALSTVSLTRLRDIANASSLGNAMLIRAGGVVYFAVLAEQEQLSAIDAMTKVAENVFAAVAGMKGAATLLHAPQTLKQRINVWGTPRADFSLMERVKHAFDPDNIFAPGRFVGGL